MPLTRRKIEVPLPVAGREDLTLESLISPQPNQEAGKITQEQSFKKTNIIQLTQLLGQLSDISQYAHELFAGLIKQTNETSERINNIKARISAINNNIGQVEKKMGMMTVTNTPNPELIEFKPQDSVPEANLFTKQSQPFAINEAYQKCENLPDFTEIDNLRTDGIKCSKLYSNPDFFLEQYMDKMNKDIENRKKRKEERKKDKVRLRKEKKINEISKKQYNSDGEVINQRSDQERKRESRKSKLSQGNINPVEVMSPTTGNAPAGVPPPPSMPTMPTIPAMSAMPNTTSTVAPPPPPSMAAPGAGAPPLPPPQFMNMPQVPVVNTNVPPPMPQVPVVNTNAPPPPPPPPVAANAPPPPPPPAASNAPPPPPPPAGGAAPLPPSNTNSLLSAIQQRPQLRPANATPAPAPANTRDDLLTNIKMGGFKLRKVEINEKRKSVDDLEGRNDVAALLIRRVALEDSDSSESEESDSDSDDDWD